MWERHLEPLGPHLVVVALADPDLDEEVKEKMGRKLLELRHLWHPGTVARLPRGLTRDSTWWEVPEGEEEEGQPREPSLEEFITPSSFLFFYLLNWDVEDLDVFGQPVAEWKDNANFNNFCCFVNGSMDDGVTAVSFLNDRSERCSMLKLGVVQCSKV